MLGCAGRRSRGADGAYEMQTELKYRQNWGGEGGGTGTSFPFLPLLHRACLFRHRFYLVNFADPCRQRAPF